MRSTYKHTSLRAALVAAFVVSAGVVSAQQGAGLSAMPQDVASIDRTLLSLREESARLEEEGRRLEAEGQGVDPQRAALRARARRQVRTLYHLKQGESLALRAGPDALLEHVGHTGHTRRSLLTTLRELREAGNRAERVAHERARVQRELATLQERRTALMNQRRTAEALAGFQLGVTRSGLDLDPLGGAAPANTGPTTVYGGNASATAPREGTFGDAAGRLLFPIAGRAEVRRVMRAGADGPGLEISAPLGAPVRAVYAGRVAFADRYGTFGRIVIVDHGDRHYTVSANLGTVSAHVGDEVTTGTVLGTVGDDGHGPQLYFEVRRGSLTIDPAPWLGL